MKVTELKVGDWVVCNSEPLRIAEINLFLCSAWDKNEDFHGGISIDRLTPIPLTSEILEKNGWKNDNKDEDLWFIMYALGKLCIEFHEWKDCGMLALVSVRNGEDDVPLLHIKHIHELQHLLWALGIDDDLKI